MTLSTKRRPVSLSPSSKLKATTIFAFVAIAAGVLSATGCSQNQQPAAVTPSPTPSASASTPPSAANPILSSAQVVAQQANWAAAKQHEEALIAAQSQHKQSGN